MLSDNSTNNIESDWTEMHWTVILSTTAMVALVILTVIGNVFVIISVFVYKPLMTVPNFFIVSLATADLAAALLVMPFHITVNVVNVWALGGIFCDIWLTSDVLICTASILNICIIALDRYWAIHDPIAYAQKRTIKRVLVMIALSWAVSAVISVPPLLGWSTTGGDGLYHPETMSCRLNRQVGYVIYSACGSFFIPLCVMSFVYLKIFLAMRRRMRKKAQSAKPKLLAVKSDEKQVCKTPPCHAKLCEPKISCDKKDVKNLDVDDSLKENASTSLLNLHGNQNNGAPESKSLHTINTFFEEKQRISLSKERKAARTLAIIMITFIICWLPFFTLYVIMPFCAVCSETMVIVEIVFVWLGYLNSTLNPIIYTIFNREFRRAFQALISGKCRNYRR